MRREQPAAGERVVSRTEARAVRVLEDHGRGGVRRLLPFLGPAFVASVAYIDPGNFATNIQGGAQFGYLLLWVVVASNLMAMLVQSLSAKLGIATGRNLAELCRDEYPRWWVWAMWVISELVAIATDLAEFLGAALGFFLLLHIPLLVSAFITGAATLVILGLERRGFRPIEVVISGFVGLIALAYVVELFLVRPPLAPVLRGGLIPGFAGSESVLLAAGILGATVMPHVIFLHSALTQRRVVPRNDEQARRLFRFEVADVVLAMGVAGLVNMAMLIMAAATFHARGIAAVGTIEQAHRTLTPLLGSVAGLAFGVSLLASGLSSSTVGTMAGQVIMQGFIHRQIPIWLRRTLTMTPAIVVIALGVDPTRTLVLSQVVLSFGLPFALVPLAHFTSKRSVMGALVNSRPTVAAIWLVTVAIVALNLFLLFKIFSGEA